MFDGVRWSELRRSCREMKDESGRPLTVINVSSARSPLKITARSLCLTLTAEGLIFIISLFYFVLLLSEVAENCHIFNPFMQAAESCNIKVLDDFEVFQ